MVAVISVAGIAVEPGQRVMREVTAQVAGRTVTVPIIAINGAADGPRVTITGGVHGAEYVGIEAARRLGVGIDPRDVSGSIVVVPIANTTAFHARAIYTSGLDDRNVNRQFPGDAHGAPSEALADWLFAQVIRPSRYYIMRAALRPRVTGARPPHTCPSRRASPAAMTTPSTRLACSASSCSCARCTSPSRPDLWTSGGAIAPLECSTIMSLSGITMSRRNWRVATMRSSISIAPRPSSRSIWR